MSTEIVNLDEVVPDDIEFQYRGEKYLLPGDISTRDTFRIQNLLSALADAEVGTIKASGQGGQRLQKAIAAQERVTLEVEAYLLGLFKERRPDLEALPFGAAGMQSVLAHVLIKLGFRSPIDPAEPEKPADPPKPRPKKKPTASRSRRSSTS